MMRSIQCFLFSSILLFSANGFSQDNNSVELHIQLYDEGICTPMLASINYNNTRFQKTKTVLQSGSYYSTIYASVNSLDSADLKPQSNHQLQSSSLQLNPNLDYELVITKQDGFRNTALTTMTIKISKLNRDAQLILPFKKGNFEIEKMMYFKKIKPSVPPDFGFPEDINIKNTLTLDSTSYYSNGKTKAKFYKITENFPLYYTQEFDSVNSTFYAQGFRLLSLYGMPEHQISTGIWTNSESSKYGYWEYHEDGKRIKHELWASMLQQKFEWYPTGQLRRGTFYGNYNKISKYTHYLENGDLKEEFYRNSTATKPILKTYHYSDQGKRILENTYNNYNGIIKQSLQKRVLFYPSGNVKMEEEFGGTYNIKYYNEDGKERIN